MKKIIYIAFYYNHTNEIASKRLQGLAKYLPEYGFEPIVIVPETGNKIPENNIRVVQTPYTDMMDKFMPKSDSKEVSAPKKESKPNKILSKMIHYAGEVFAYPDGMKYWYTPAMKETSRIIENEDIYGIISTSFPVTSHIIAHDLAAKYDLPWIADLRDLWNLNPYINHFFIRDYSERKLEKKTFANASVLTTTTEMARDRLQSLHPNKKIISVPSGYDPDDFKDLKPSKTDDQLRFMYAGSLYNGKRDPTILFSGIKQLIDEGKIDSDKITLDFYGDRGNLEELSSKFKITDIVNVNGKIPHDQVLKEQMNSDVLLLISWMDEKEKMFIPGKVYEYMGCRKPVLSIGYREGSLKDMIEKTNIGYHASSEDEAKKYIYEYYTKYLNNELEYNANEYAKEYTMKNMAKRYAEILEEIK